MAKKLTMKPDGRAVVEEVTGQDKDGYPTVNRWEFPDALQAKKLLPMFGDAQLGTGALAAGDRSVIADAAADLEKKADR